MPAIDFSGPLLAAGADYAAEDWGNVSAGAELDLDNSAQLKRGINLALGAQALVNVDGALQKFLAADLQGEAHAAARVQAQVQVPIDLFSEFGLAVRVQAIAEAAAAVDLAIGLSIGDFLAIADQDLRLQGPGLQMLRILLEESVVEGGVKGKVAASAMAHASYALTGQLVGKPGFTVAAEAGLGLAAGAGFRGYATFGIEEPRRLIRRAVDLTVDQTIQALTSALATPGDQSLVNQLRIPAKIAFRSCLEIGMALAGSDAFGNDAGPVLAQRCIQVSLEEAQRGVLEAIGAVAGETIAALLAAERAGEQLWTDIRPQRLALAARLRALSDNPFDTDPAGQTQAKWQAVFNAADTLIGNQQNSPLALPFAQLWAATELMIGSVTRISTAAARASMIGAAPKDVIHPYAGPVDAPPASLLAAFRTALGPGSSAALTLEQLVTFVMKPEVLNPVIGRFPELKALLDLFRDGGDSDLKTVSRVMSNLNSLDFGGVIDPMGALNILIAQLQKLIGPTLRNQIRPPIDRALAGSPEWTRLYTDEVVLPSLDYAVNRILGAIPVAIRNGSVKPSQIREVCSCIVFRLLSRALVVTGDVMSDWLLSSMSDAMTDLAKHAGDAGGVVDELAKATGLDRDTLVEICTDVLEIAAKVYAPLGETERARVRELGFAALDIEPDSDADNFQTQLANDFFVPNLESATALALELGKIIAERIEDTVGIAVDLLATAALQELEGVIQAVENAAAQWVTALQTAVGQLADALRGLVQEAEARSAAAAAALGDVVNRVLAIFGQLGGSDARAALRAALLAFAQTEARGVLQALGIYRSLPSGVRNAAVQALDGVVDALLDNAFANAIFDALRQVTAGVQEISEGVKGFDPSRDLIDQLLEFLADRAEDAVRAQLGGLAHMEIGLNLGFVNIPVGRVNIPLDGIVAAVRSGAMNADAIRGSATVAAQSISVFLGLQTLADEAARDRDAAQAAHASAAPDLAESRLVSPSIEIQSPLPGAAAADGAPLSVRLRGVPRSYLGLEAGQMQRVVIWLNQKELTITADRVSTVTTAPRTPIAVQIPGVIAPVVNQGALQAFSRQAAPTGGLKGFGLAGGNGSVIAPVAHSAPLGRIAAPVLRTDAGSSQSAGGIPDLQVTVAMPDGVAVSGLNTLVVAVVDGDAARRCSASSAFLLPDASNMRDASPPEVALPKFWKPGAIQAQATNAIASLGARTGGKPAPAAPPARREGGFVTAGQRAEMRKVSQLNLQKAAAKQAGVLAGAAADVKTLAGRAKDRDDRQTVLRNVVPGVTQVLAQMGRKP